MESKSFYLHHGLYHRDNEPSIDEKVEHGNSTLDEEVDDYMTKKLITSSDPLGLNYDFEEVEITKL